MYILKVKAKREGTMGCLLHQSPKFYNNVFLFISFTTLGTLVNFDWLVIVNKLSVQTQQPLILQKSTKLIILCIIIGDVQKFIGHCLIPLEPCQKLHIIWGFKIWQSPKHPFFQHNNSISLLYKETTKNTMNVHTFIKSCLATSISFYQVIL